MQNPDDPLDDGAVRLPKVDSAMNRVAPNDLSNYSDKVRPLRAKYTEEAEEDSVVLARARKRLERCISVEADNRREGLDDDKFYAGDQWSQSDRARRNSERRPCLTVNKLPTLVKQVTNDQRQNRPTLDIHPVGDKSDVDVAKIYRGLIREIERDSRADRAYDTGFESAVRKGWGYWRIITDWADVDTFDQILLIRRIRNSYSVYIDPDSTEIDGSDAKFGFITEMIDRDEFKAQFPNADPMPWTTSGYGDSYKNWIDQFSIRIAEYYETKLEPRELVLLNNGFEGWRDELDSSVLEKFKIVDRRRSLVPKITWYKLTAKQVLEKTPWLGRWIPIVRVVGDEQDIEGKVKHWGIIRHAKDPQRILNYYKTSETERVALAPKAPYLITEGQLEGFEAIWQEANTKSFPYLPYRATELHNHLVPPPQRVPPVEVPAGVVQAAKGAAEDMLATTGVRFDATLNERTYDESGRALRELRRSGDIGSFNYIDNLMHSLKHTGDILVDLIPKIYKRPGRVATIIRDDGSEEQIKIQPNSPKPVIENKDTEGRITRAFDPTYGRYAVTVTIGPSYATRRIETAESLMAFMRAIPQSASLIADLVAKNQDWDGAEEIAARLAKTLPPGMIQPEMRDIPPQIQALLSQAQRQIQQLTMERQQLMMQVADRNADRQLARDRINRQFEAQLLNIVQKAQTAAQKVSAEDRRSEAENLHNLASDVLSLYGDLTKTDLQSINKQSENGSTSPNQMQQPQPPIPGARLAPDGNFYIPDQSRPGKYLKVVGYNRPSLNA